MSSLPEKPEELVVMSWGGIWGRALEEAVSRPFAERTGIPVRQVRNIGLALPDRLLEALRDGRKPPFHVVWSNAAPALRSAVAGHCEILGEADVPSLRALDHRARPELGDGCIAFPYLVHYVLAYREEAFSDGPPRSWQVLLEPRLSGRIALYPGGNGFFPIAQVMGGGTLADIPERMEPCWKFLRLLAPQIGRLDYSIGVGELLRRGELDLCFRALPNALGFREEGLQVAWCAPEEGITETMDALWVPRHVAPSAGYWAKRYIDYALTAEVQERWCGRLGVVASRPEVSLPAALREEPSFPADPLQSPRVLHLPEELKARRERRWEAEFRRFVG